MLKLFSFIQHKRKTQKHEKGCNNHDYCYVEMPDKGNQMLKHYHGEKPLKAPFMIYADLECLLEKMHSCQNNLKRSYIEKKLSIRLLAIHCLQIVHLMQQKNKLDCCRGKDCMEKFCKDLRDHAMKIINYEEKEMIPLTDKVNKSYKMQKVFYICKK